MANKPTYEELEQRVEDLEKEDMKPKRMGEALRKSEEHYRILIETIPHSIQEIDTTGTLTFVNDAYCRLMGYEEREVLGKPIFDFIEFETPSGKEELREYLKLLVKDQPLRTPFFQRDRRKDGKVLDVQVDWNYKRNEQGLVTGFISVLTDITEHRKSQEELRKAHRDLEKKVEERTAELTEVNEQLNREIERHKQTEVELRESEERFRSLVETTSDWIWEVDSSGVYTYCSPRVEELLGYKPEELIGRTPFDLMPSDEAERIAAILRNFVSRQRAFEKLENVNLHKDGRRVVLETSYVSVFDASGSLVAYRGVDRDITDRKLAEDALRESEQRYARAERIGRFGHWDGDFIEDWSVWSKETYRIFGIDPAKFQPTYEEFLNFIHPADREKVKSSVQLLITQGGETDLEYRIIRPDGEVRSIHSMAEVHLDKNGKPRKSLGMLHDITESKRMEQEIAKVQRLESLGILAGGIAHDFNNILTAILANISMAKLYGALQNDISQMLTEAENASLRAKKLTQQLLTFAKGGAPIRRIMSISELLKETAEFALSGSEIRCKFSIPDDLWLIEADEGQISQVIQNLIINADQAMPRGGAIRICAENTIIGENDVPLLKKGRYLKISITDQGTGIAKKDLPNIFDPFFTTKQKGSGLGLATTFSIVNNHDGHIGVDSEVEVGTTFYVYLPASRKTSKPEERAKDKPIKGDGRILLIDDEEIIRRSAGEVLKRLGYQVKVAEDREEGINLYERALKGKQPFDAVIMDLTIPGDMEGREAIKKFKKIDRDVKVIVSSGYSDAPAMSNFREYGFSGVVAKPYTIGDLGEVLDKVISEKRG